MLVKTVERVSTLLRESKKQRQAAKELISRARSICAKAAQTCEDTSGLDPKWVMMAPVDAVRLLWKNTGWDKDDVGL